MAYLILGLVLFLGVHSVRIVADDWRGWCTTGKSHVGTSPAWVSRSVTDPTP